VRERDRKNRNEAKGCHLKRGKKLNNENMETDREVKKKDSEYSKERERDDKKLNRGKRNVNESGKTERQSNSEREIKEHTQRERE
jgi:hypothetical protein